MRSGIRVNLILFFNEEFDNFNSITKYWNYHGNRPNIERFYYEEIKV